MNVEPEPTVTRRLIKPCRYCSTPAYGVYCEHHRRLTNKYQRERKRRVLGLKRRFLNAESYDYK